MALVPIYPCRGKDLHPGTELGTTWMTVRYLAGASNFEKGEIPEEANAPSAPSVIQSTGGVFLWRPRAAIIGASVCGTSSRPRG